MQDNPIQMQAQPFVKLMRSNMELLAQFSTSPEVASQTAANGAQLLQQASESGMKLMQSGAYLQLMQGMMKNYAEFLGDVAQGTMTALSQGQAALMRQAQDASNEAVDASEGRTKRSRQGS